MNDDFTAGTKPWHKQLIHCLDFEGGHRSGIVEYGLVSILGLGVVHVETRLCRGFGPIPEWETATHQIRNSDVELLDTVSESWELFRDARKAGPFAAHHAGVENGLIKSVWPFTTPSHNFITGEMDVEWGPWLDTCALYRALFPDLTSYNLAMLIDAFDLSKRLDSLAAHFCPKDRSSFHCAAYDALASAVLLLQLEDYQETRSLTLGQLLMWSQSGFGPNDSNSQMELL